MLADRNSETGRIATPGKKQKNPVPEQGVDERLHTLISQISLPELAPCALRRLPGFAGPLPSTSRDKAIQLLSKNVPISSMGVKHPLENGQFNVLALHLLQLRLLTLTTAQAFCFLSLTIRLMPQPSIERCHFRVLDPVRTKYTIVAPPSFPVEGIGFLYGCFHRPMPINSSAAPSVTPSCSNILTTRFSAVKDDLFYSQSTKTRGDAQAKSC